MSEGRLHARKRASRENTGRRTIKDGDTPPCSPVKKAKQNLADVRSNRILGRTEEFRVLTEFLSSHLETNTPGSMYISGAPGTGKTACLMNVLDDYAKAQRKFTSVFINCMALTNSTSIYDKVIQSCGKTGSGLELLKKLVTSKGQPIVIVLDEIDQLDNRNVLYSLLELPQLNNSRLILFGIANALDLTDRIVPHLQAYGCKPRLLHFSPYTQREIESILSDRLHEWSTVVQPVALELCARKVAACTGDVRKALDICRRAIQVAVLSPRPEHGYNSGSPRKSSQPRVGVSHILAVISSGDLTGAATDLPLQQKLLLCAILVTIKSRKLRDIPQGKLQEAYCRICKKHQVFVDQSDFQSLCTLLEARGLIRIKKHKEARLCKVTLCIDETQVEHVLEDKALLASCLADHGTF
ncbi:cell division control protein 6 homolog [Ornithodoros turicata]|uniref:cell division control protein 6 homolog n=1 Tax=Ornithodoros turicata TaxID=34597 RepID=UPI003139E95B